MSTINTNPAMSSALAARQADESAGQATLNSDFQTFLEMLTAQATNQDPLNPMESSEYASQLASFSSVEQQVKTNDLLAAFGEQLGASTLSQLSNWVGMEARSTAPVTFDGTPQTLHPLLATQADQAYLIAYDENGEEVQRQQIDIDTESVQWAGVDDTGAPFENGTYRFEIENFANGESLGTSPVETYQRVEEAQMLDGQIALILEGGQPIFSTDVVAIRE
ncbi:flagellar hook capping FlgD N-terminal domain-containing protein [Roseovarius sp.]|uniref:flagellar hook capping FlgD N-terminal domain-containing protein n=1 Tax=Roseovarius sp. TaxID=1486281 RepID=UPI0035657DC8